MVSEVGGEENRKAGSVPGWMRAAARLDRAAMTGYNSIRHPKAQPGSFFSLGSEEWLEDARNVSSGNTHSVVGDGDPDASDRRIF